MDVQLRCTTCYPIRLGNCPDTLSFSLSVTPDTTYDYEICDSMGNVYEGTTTTDGSGNVSISTSDVPFDAYPGLFNKFAGSFRFTLYDDNGDAVPFTISGTEYTCIAFSLKDTVEIDECNSEVLCGCLFGGYGAPSDLTGSDNDFYINANNGSIYEKVDGTWTLFWAHSATSISDGDYGDITVSGSGAVWTIDTQVVTFAKMQHIATQKLLGRHAAGTGDIQEIGLDGGVEFQGGNLKAKVDGTSIEISSTNISRAALTGDVTASAGSNTTTIANDAVTFAKMQNIATDKLLGRDTALSGNVEEIGLNATLEFDGAGNIQRAALTGDVTASAGSNTTTIANDAVTFAKMQNITTSRILGRTTAGSGDVEEISVGTGLTLSGGVLAASGGTSPLILFKSYTTISTSSGTGYGSPNYLYFGSILIPANTVQAGDIIQVQWLMRNNGGGTTSSGWLLSDFAGVPTSTVAPGTNDSSGHKFYLAYMSQSLAYHVGGNVAIVAAATGFTAPASSTSAANLLANGCINDTLNTQVTNITQYADTTTVWSADRYVVFCHTSAVASSTTFMGGWVKILRPQ